MSFPANVLPRPLELVARVALVATVLLWLGNHHADRIVRPLIPVFQHAVAVLDDDFTVLGLDLSTDTGNSTLRVRADLAHPIQVAGKWLVPMNSSPRTAGWVQVDLTLGGVLQYPLLLLIVVIAWPAAGIREFAMRAGIAMPLVVALLLMDVPLTVLAELWFPIHDEYDAAAFWPLLACSRFMMGGGGQVLALVMGVAAIGIARWLDNHVSISAIPASSTPGTSAKLY